MAVLLAPPPLRRKPYMKLTQLSSGCHTGTILSNPSSRHVKIRSSSEGFTVRTIHNFILVARWRLPGANLHVFTRSEGGGRKCRHHARNYRKLWQLTLQQYAARVVNV